MLHLSSGKSKTFPMQSLSLSIWHQTDMQFVSFLVRTKHHLQHCAECTASTDSQFIRFNRLKTKLSFVRFPTAALSSPHVLILCCISVIATDIFLYSPNTLSAGDARRLLPRKDLLLLYIGDGFKSDQTLLRYLVFWNNCASFNRMFYVFKILT